MKIGNDQIKILNLATQYYKKLTSIGVDVAASAYCWLLNIPGAPGYFILRGLKDNKKLNIKGIYFFLNSLLQYRYFMILKYFKKLIMK